LIYCRFYEGTVKSYDSSKRKHVVSLHSELVQLFFLLTYSSDIIVLWHVMWKILYDDGDVEVLCLEKERWELIDKGGKPNKVSNFPFFFILFFGHISAVLLFPLKDIKYRWSLIQFYFMFLPEAKTLKNYIFPWSVSIPFTN